MPNISQAEPHKIVGGAVVDVVEMVEEAAEGLQSALESVPRSVLGFEGPLRPVDRAITSTVDKTKRFIQHVTGTR